MTPAAREISRFSCTEPVVRAWDLRPRKAHQRLATNAASSLACRHGDESRHPEMMLFRGSITPACTPRVNASLRPRGSPAHDSGPTPLARSSSQSSLISCSMPVIPTLSPSTSCRRPRSQPESRTEVSPGARAHTTADTADTAHAQRCNGDARHSTPEQLHPGGSTSAACTDERSCRPRPRHLEFGRFRAQGLLSGWCHVR